MKIYIVHNHYNVDKMCNTSSLKLHFTRMTYFNGSIHQIQIINFLFFNHSLIRFSFYIELL